MLGIITITVGSMHFYLDKTHEGDDYGDIATGIWCGIFVSIRYHGNVRFGYNGKEGNLSKYQSP